MAAFSSDDVMYRGGLQLENLHIRHRGIVRSLLIREFTAILMPWTDGLTSCRQGYDGSFWGTTLARASFQEVGQQSQEEHLRSLSV